MYSYWVKFSDEKHEFNKERPNQWCGMDLICLVKQVLKPLNGNCTLVGIIIRSGLTIEVHHRNHPNNSKLAKVLFKPLLRFNYT